MLDSYDIVVLGGDLNGLTSAAILAKNGHKVLLIEEGNFYGGLAAAVPLGKKHVVPGMLHDTSIMRVEVSDFLKLENFGLQYEPGRHDISHVDHEGKLFQLPADPAKALAYLQTASPADVEGYKAYRELIDHISPILYAIFSEYPPDILDPKGGELLSLIKKLVGFRKLGNRIMTEFLKVAPMSIKDFLDEKFTHEGLKAILAMQACKASFMAPMSSYSTLNLLMWECLSKRSVKGGPPAMVKALRTAAESHGVTLNNEVAVKRIVMKTGKVSGVVIDDGKHITCRAVFSVLTPTRTFFDLCRPMDIPAHLEKSVKDYRSEGTAGKVHLLLDKLPDPLAGEDIDNHVYILCEDMVTQEKAFDPIKYGQFSDRPVLEVRFSGSDNKGDKATGVIASVLVHYLPYRVKGGWSEDKESRVIQHVITRLSSVFTGFEQSVKTSDFWSPYRLEKEMGITGGHLYHGEQAIDQLFTRPFPSCARYKSPLEGIYLCGSSAFPGGGLSCAPGFLAAKSYKAS